MVEEVDLPADPWDDEPDDGFERLSESDLVLEQLDSHRRLSRLIECRQLVTVVDWAELHPGVTDPTATQQLGRERAVQFGGQGTPLVAEFAPAELAVATRSTTFGAGRLIADGLDLAYRLPRLWDRVRANEIDVWQARKIAQATRHLSPEAAAQVDADLADIVGTLAWSRTERIMTGRIISADPEAAAAAARRAAQARYVRKGRANTDGVSTLYARMDAAEATWLDATITLLAELLVTHRGSTDAVDVRRAQALGLLARPGDALSLLAEQASTNNTQPAPAPGPEPEAAATPEPDAGADAGWREEPWDSAAWPDIEPAVPRIPRTHPGHHPNPAPPNQWFETGDAADVERRHPAALFGQVEALTRLTETLADPRLCQALRPAAVLHFHVAGETVTNIVNDQTGPGVVDGPVRSTELGPQPASLVKTWLGVSQVKLLPVIDLPAGELPVDAYEIPARLRRHLAERVPGSLFPWSGSMTGLDLDHTRPYDHGDGQRPPPPGQTRTGNLAPHSRREHRILTHHAGWQRRQPCPGLLVLRTPHGRVLVTSTSHGTHDLGTGSLANAIWSAVK